MSRAAVGLAVAVFVVAGVALGKKKGASGPSLNACIDTFAEGIASTVRLDSNPMVLQAAAMNFQMIGLTASAACVQGMISGQKTSCKEEITAEIRRKLAAGFPEAAKPHLDSIRAWLISAGRQDAADCLTTLVPGYVPANG